MAAREAADLLVADQDYKRPWSIQVKTNRKPASFWLLSKDYREVSSASRIYLFVILRGDTKRDYYIVPSRVAARCRDIQRQANGRTTSRLSTRLPSRLLRRGD